MGICENKETLKKWPRMKKMLPRNKTSNKNSWLKFQLSRTIYSSFDQVKSIKPVLLAQDYPWCSFMATLMDVYAGKMAKESWQSGQ